MMETKKSVSSDRIKFRGNVLIRGWKNVKTHEQLLALANMPPEEAESRKFGFQRKNLVLIDGELIFANALLYGDYTISHMAFGSGGVSVDDILIPVPPERTDTALENEQFRIEIQNTSKLVLENPSGLQVSVTALSADFNTVDTISEAALVCNSEAPSSTDRKDLVSRVTFPSIPFASLSVGLVVQWSIYLDSAS